MTQEFLTDLGMHDTQSYCRKLLLDHMLYRSKNVNLRLILYLSQVITHCLQISQTIIHMIAQMKCLAFMGLHAGTLYITAYWNVQWWWGLAGWWVYDSRGAAKAVFTLQAWETFFYFIFNSENAALRIVWEEGVIYFSHNLYYNLPWFKYSSVCW